MEAGPGAEEKGAEVDEDLGWGVVSADGTVRTGSYLDLKGGSLL